MTIKNQYIKYAEQISSETEYAPTPSPLCAFCDFLEHCPEGKEKANSNQMQSHKVYGEVNW